MTGESAYYTRVPTQSATRGESEHTVLFVQPIIIINMIPSAFKNILREWSLHRNSWIVTCACILLVIQIQVALAETPKPKPEFLESVPNVTVAVGRDASLPCVVKNLQDYKVAFIHIDRQMILTIHKQVITRMPRFSIAHDKHLTWTLNINKVQEEDKGFYMCQVNTDPMLSTVGYLDVVVPPNIVDAESSPSTVSVRETHNATLICKAEGTPQPEITWRREEEKKIVIKRKKKEGKKEKRIVHGEVLDLIRISRTEMGAYLCIAKNGVPPSVSKRIILTVEFAPMIWIPHMLVGAPRGSEIKLECHTEASPKAIAYWVFNGNMVLKTATHSTNEQHHSNYKLDSQLIIKNLQESDYGTYKCISKNSLGENEGSIMVYELDTATEPPSKPNLPVSVFGDDYGYMEYNSNEDDDNDDDDNDDDDDDDENEEEHHSNVQEANKDMVETTGNRKPRVGNQFGDRKVETSHSLWGRSSSDSGSEMSSMVSLLTCLFLYKLTSY